MLLFRSLALGLLGACFFLIATRPTTIVVRQSAPIEVPNLSGMRGLPTQGPTVIDVARDVHPRMLPGLIRLDEGEHIVSIDDVPVANDLDAGRVLAERWTAPSEPVWAVGAPGAHSAESEPSRPIELHRYIDMQLRGLHGDRRLLVLLH